MKERFINFFNNVLFFKEIYFRKINNWFIIKRISKKDKINVVFVVLYDSIWKCDELYKKMRNSNYYNPIVLICPIVNFGRENMLFQMDKSYETFAKRGYNPIRSYDKNNNTYIDLKKDLSADIILYTNPYDGLIDDRYNIRNVRSILTCYIPYFYNTTKLKFFYDLPFHRFLWKYFIESEYHLSFMKKSSKLWRYSNCQVVGYSVFDDFETSNKNLGVINHPKKNIIWAPHHTINENEIFTQSSFLLLHDKMLKFCEKYKNEANFIFRPHPLLKLRLYQHKDWGIKKTDEYYNRWNHLENGKLSDGGDYIKEFYNSDALIHDCGSFLCEYLYIGKPAIYISMDEDNYLPSLNPIAKEAYYSHYLVYDELQLEEKLKEVIINNNDELAIKRKLFKEKYLKTSNELVSDKIMRTFNIIFNK